MAGHSKWANIKHRKAAQDAKRGKLFTKLIRELTVAARLGGPEIEDNPRLRAAVDKALGSNMPKDTIERAIKRGAGDDDGTQYETLRYEGYAPGGVAIMVDCLTDNRNRTVAEVRHAFNKAGGNLGTDGSVAYLFSRQGVIAFAPGTEEDSIMEPALEAGAEDIVAEADGSVEVVTAPEDFYAVRDALQAAGFEPEHAEVTERPATTVALEGEEAGKALGLMDALEDLDDVQNVYTNADFDEESLTQAASWMIRILGIDPGSRATGYGIIDVAGVEGVYVDSGVIRVGDGPMPERLLAIHTAIGEIIDQHRPTVASVESVFMRNNASSALKLGQARGVALCALAAAGLPVSEYAPASIKQALVGRGRAEKEQIQHMVTALLKLPRQPAEDAADALAAALCHCRTGATMDRIQAAMEART